MKYKSIGGSQMKTCRIYKGFVLVVVVCMTFGASGVCSALSGDVNEDGNVNVFDALQVLQYAVGLYHPPNENAFKLLSDVAPLNALGAPMGDGTVNVFDALAVLRHAVNLDDWTGLPKPPLAPSNFKALAGSGSISYTWDTVPETTGYNLYYSTTSGVTKSNGTKIPAVTTPKTISGLNNGIPYHAVVTAVNSIGESAESVQVSATPLYVNGAPVSGTITSGGFGLAGVTLQYGIGMYTATTDSSGTYSFNTSPNGSATITPSKNGYTFSPVNQTVTVSGANITGINFTATATAVSTTGFTSDMLSGKIFNDSQGSIMTFNTNGTFLQSGHPESMTWSINSSGQLVVANRYEMTLNLISGSLTTGLVYSSSTTSSNTGTLTLVNSGTTTAGFIAVMINGRTFQFVTPDSSGSITFNSNNTISATKYAASGGGTSGGTWSINSSGQLIIFYTADGGTYTMTLISKTVASITAAESWTKPSGNGSDAMTFTGTVGS